MAAINVDKTCSVLPISPQDRRETSVLTDCDVNKILERRLGSGSFRLVGWLLAPIGERNGYLGQYHHLRITARVNGETANLQFFVKTPPPGHSRQFQFMQKYDLFNKEIEIYTNVMQRMGTGGRSKWTVECYLCKQNTVMVLEDASLDGYVMPDKYVPFDEDHCVWLLTTLSSLHSRSLILDESLRREGKSLLDLYGHVLRETLFINGDETSEKLRASAVTGFYTVIELVEGLDHNEKSVVKRRVTEWFREIARLLAPSSRDRNVICHRDLWANNLLYRYDPSGVPNGCYIIDYQFFCYSPPAIDFTCCLYLTTDRATRDRHFDSFAKIYHDSLGQGLAEEGLCVEDCLPWTAFRDSYTNARNIALIYATFMMVFEKIGLDYIGDSIDAVANTEMYLYGDKRPDLVRHEYQNSSKYKTRLSEIVFEINDCLPEHPPNF